MNKIILLTLALFAHIFSMNAQSHAKLTVFNDEGNRFMLTLNGEIMNESHELRVEADELVQSQYSAVVNFESQNLGIVRKNLFLEPGNHYVFRIATNRRGRQVMRLFSTAPLTDFVEESSPRPNPLDRMSDAEQTATPAPKTKTTQEEKARDAQNPSQESRGKKTKVTMTMPDGSMFQMKVETDDDIEPTADMPLGPRETVPSTEEPEAKKQEEAPVVYVEGYSGRIGCPHPMSSKEISGVISTIEGQSFSDSKLRTAKRALKNKCIKVSDVKKIMDLFSFEDSKLDFAKYAYSSTHDIDNYYLLYNNFSFEFSIEELEEYIDELNK